jgi:hypothetical protein
MDETLHRASRAQASPPARTPADPVTPMRSLHRRILRQFADHTTAPAPPLLGEWAHNLDGNLGTALDQLVATDLVETDPSARARLLGAYPLSAVARGRQVVCARLVGQPGAVLEDPPVHHRMAVLERKPSPTRDQRRLDVSFGALDDVHRTHRRVGQLELRHE